MIELTKRRIDVQSDGRNFVAQIWVWRVNPWADEATFGWRKGEATDDPFFERQPPDKFRARTPEKAYEKALQQVRASQRAELLEKVRLSVIHTGSYSEIFDTSEMMDDLLTRELRDMIERGNGDTSGTG